MRAQLASRLTCSSDSWWHFLSSSNDLFDECDLPHNGVLDNGDTSSLSQLRFTIFLGRPPQGGCATEGSSVVALPPHHMNAPWPQSWADRFAQWIKWGPESPLGRDLALRMGVPEHMFVPCLHVVDWRGPRYGAAVDGRPPGPPSTKP